MGDRMTETFEPYRPDSSYDFDYDEEPQPERTGRVLWGRVAILGVALVLAFLVGRATGGGSEGVPEADYDEAVAEVDELEGQVAALEEELAQARQATPAPTGSPGAAAGGGGGDEESDPEGESEGGETYVVEEGDTLASIAEDFYGNAALDDFLAEANGITDPERLFIGQELTIPPKPEE